MNKIGLSKWDVTIVFKRTFGDKVEKDPLVDSIARAVGEVIEENNRRILEDLANDSRKRVINL